MTDSKQQPSLLFITTADPDSTPHAEWIPWTLEKALKFRAWIDGGCLP